MAVTSNTYTVGGSGQAGPYSYGFPIIAAADIRVSVDGQVKTSDAASDFEPINIFNEDAWSNENVPEPFSNLDRFKVRKAVLENLKELNLLEKEEKYPLIIGVAGSLGWREHHYEYMGMYQESGFATFELNSFKSRNILSTVGSQVEVTTAAIILDAYSAFAELANHPNIDKNRVSITGWSLGGAVALFSGWKPVMNAITDDLKFASHLAFYPPCFFDPENTEFTDAPIHILIGELDNWTPSEPCVNFVKKITKNSNVYITVYPISNH